MVRASGLAVSTLLERPRSSAGGILGAPPHHGHPARERQSHIVERGRCDLGECRTNILRQRPDHKERKKKRPTDSNASESTPPSTFSTGCPWGGSGVVVRATPAASTRVYPASDSITPMGVRSTMRRVRSCGRLGLECVGLDEGEGDQSRLHIAVVDESERGRRSDRPAPPRCPRDRPRMLRPP